MKRILAILFLCLLGLGLFALGSYAIWQTTGYWWAGPVTIGGTVIVAITFIWSITELTK